MADVEAPAAAAPQQEERPQRGGGGDDRQQQPRRKPGWMSIPGGPTEPNRNDFYAKLQKFSGEKTALFARLRKIREEFDTRDDSERDEINKERAALRQRLTQIEGLRQKQRDSRRAKDEEMSKVRQQRAEIENHIRELSGELGAFRELDEIEAAIDHVLIKMETGSGTLKAEKATIKRLTQLEEAKTLIIQLQPLQERIKEADEKEAQLFQQYREIHERINDLNKEYEEGVSTKNEKEKALKKTGTDRQALMKERQEIRTRLGGINADIDVLRETFNAQQEAWAKWREKAMAQYRAEQDAARKEREKRWMEREQAYNQERAREKVLRRLNPYAQEIDVCTNLIRYLEEKINSQRKDREKAEHQKKLAAFDPDRSAPEGTVLARVEDEWLFADRTRKQQKQKSHAKATEGAKEGESAAQRKSRGDKHIQHSLEKMRSFEMVNVEVPLTFSQIAPRLEILRKKKKEYESHIRDEGEVNPDEIPDEEPAQEAA